MYNPAEFEAVCGWTEYKLLLLPAPDDRFSILSANLTPERLSHALGVHGSAFWNSGGGLVAIGMGKRGSSGWGVPTVIDALPAADFIRSALRRVEPTGPFAVQALPPAGPGSPIRAGHAVVVVGFGASLAGPHMAPDHRTYIRAGGRSEPAGATLVEALRARTALAAPVLIATVRPNPNRPSSVQLGLVAVTDAPAVEVTVSLEPVPRVLATLGSLFPLTVSHIDRQTPFFLNLPIHRFNEYTTVHEQPFTVCVRFRDLAGRTYERRLPMDLTAALNSLGAPGSTLTEDVSQALERLASGINEVGDMLRIRR